ncbi:MAG: TRAM domain-containing protein [Planctomycetes bacterium]|nr:TRAM domain-containing protein [Planctomycetota bacterium]
MVWILRAIFMAITIGIASSVLIFADYFLNFEISLALFLGVMAVGGAIIGMDVMAKNKQITTVSAIFFGLLVGFLLSELFWMALRPILNLSLENLLRTWVPLVDQRDRAGREIEHFVRLFITSLSCYIAVSVLLQTKDEFRFLIPYVEFSKQRKGAKSLVLDTSVIIDGRIADICETGIIDTKLIVPRFVLQELQAIADSSDKVKRNRGRRGLDVLKRMQGNNKVEMQMHEGNLEELRNVQKVDERLVVLAKVLNARVVTNDFNLNKISQLQGVDVINLNELANALKLVALPGETLTIRVVKQGDQMGQGVGYLDDGTMVVVEQGKGLIGQDVAITVTSVLQTPAGRMIFGKIEGKPSEGKPALVTQ